MGPVRPARGKLVELVRLIIVVLFAVAGWEVATNIRPDASSVLVLGIVVGSGVGYVLGGAFGRRTAHALTEVECELRRVPAADVLASAIVIHTSTGMLAFAKIPGGEMESP